MHVARAVVSVLALAGCDHVFGLDLPGDAATASPVCWEPALIDHDEDGDAWMDGCDVCPATPDGGQEDRDGDGVGDACDPNPGDPRDRLVFFDSFETMDPRWSAYGTGGEWSFAAGEVRQTTDHGTGILIYDREFANATAEVVMRGQQTDPDNASGSNVWIRVQTYSDGTYPRAFSCGVYLKGTDIVLNFDDFLFDSPKAFSTLDSGEVARIRLSAIGHCVGSRDGKPPRIATLPEPPPTGAGKVGLSVYNSIATYESITVIETAE